MNEPQTHTHEPVTSAQRLYLDFLRKELGLTPDEFTADCLKRVGVVPAALTKPTAHRLITLLKASRDGRAI